MRLAVIAFSALGAALGAKICSLPGHEAEAYIVRRHTAETGFTPFDSAYDLTAALFDEIDALVYVGACGIAVRAVAPHVKSKLTDPAVIVCDETGRFAVSLLSGHAGGANSLTEEIAAHTGAVPVITTASDSHAALDNLPRKKNLVLGIGCRRGLAAEMIERTVTILLWDTMLPLSRVAEAATIDVKRDEAGLLAFAKVHDIPLRFFSAAELAAVPGEFTASVRVKAAVGVENVCERAAVLCGGKGELILRKTARNGVTVAVFERT